MIVADSTANVDWLTADIFAQSEHDNQAQSILVTNSQELIKKVSKNIEKNPKYEEKKNNKAFFRKLRIDDQNEKY